jgi:hypothetical protein
MYGIFHDITSRATLSPSPMRVCLFVAALLAAADARLLHSLPEDTYAFPKFRVSFLNGLPVLNETAERWLAEGLRGGELEFLDQPWKDGSWQFPSHRKEIGAGEDNEPSHEPASPSPDVRPYFPASAAPAQKLGHSLRLRPQQTILWNS